MQENKKENKTTMVKTNPDASAISLNTMIGIKFAF